ncbi:hypothetical protein H8S33_00225 [Ornithinibacillus sp. BX22]|uniref:Uncharacterized protein n=2 Tax=Ornithinibacillus TaxID=484508 RepID=A0A923L2F6_9BACI|nr:MULTISPECIES: hypothetical protein [Ornithinibacillus]MBC5635237.1 hypothetical protein [Ornithinibacillus hominis]MBS3678806.1 hypothetical protein [Ornithinibacillus massiliensis]
MKKYLLSFGALIVTISLIAMIIISFVNDDQKGNATQPDEAFSKNEAIEKEEVVSEQTLETSTIEISEYASMSDWVKNTKESLKEIPEDTTKENHYPHMGSSASIYARYYLDQTSDSRITGLLEEINDVGLEITAEPDITKQEGLIDELVELLEQLS